MREKKLKAGDLLPVLEVDLSYVDPDLALPSSVSLASSRVVSASASRWAGQSCDSRAFT